MSQTHRDTKGSDSEQGRGAGVSSGSHCEGLPPHLGARAAGARGTAWGPSRPCWVLSTTASFPGWAQTLSNVQGGGLCPGNMQIIRGRGGLGTAAGLAGLSDSSGAVPWGLRSEQAAHLCCRKHISPWRPLHGLSTLSCEKSICFPLFKIPHCLSCSISILEP